MPPATARPAASQRLWQIDALRGLMLVLMAVTHLPTRLASPLGQPFGYVSAAEGFVLLSGFMAGMVYTRRQQREGASGLREAFLQRAWKIYACQGALLVFLFTLVMAIGVLLEQPAVLDLISFFMEEPLAALFGGFLLLYNPPLMDILPMYIVFMLASPVLLLHGLQHGWNAILGLSIALWFGAQFGLGNWLYLAAVDATGLPIPLQQTGAFTVLSWQFLWVMGLWLGSTYVTGDHTQPLVFPPWMLRAAVYFAVACFMWRHAMGQIPFPDMDGFNLLFDKWTLGPLRVINLFALLVLLLHFEPWLRQHLPRMRWLEIMGAASLPVFCAHLVLVLLALALAGPPIASRPWTVDLLILAGSMGVLYSVALASQLVDQHAATVRARIKDLRRPPAAPRMAPDAMK